MKSFEDTGATGSNPAEIKWQYDLVGNMRMVHSEYTSLAVYGSDRADTEHWYTYDKMNRMVHVMGYLAGNEILNDISTVGSGYALYNAAGERTAFVTNYFIFRRRRGFGLNKEAYTYNAQGYLRGGHAIHAGDGHHHPAARSATGRPRSCSPPIRATRSAG